MKQNIYKNVSYSIYPVTVRMIGCDDYTVYYLEILGQQYTQAGYTEAEANELARSIINRSTQ